MKLPQILLGLCFMLLLASTIDAQDECTSVLDLAFIVDSSGSIRDNNPADRSYDNWLLALNFISNLVGKLPVSKERTRIGLVKFSNIGKVEFHLDQYELQSQVQSAVLNLAYVGGNTNTTGGLLVAKEEIFNVNHGDRSDVPNVAIVITDGKSTYDAEKTIDSAELLRAAGVKVFVVGISDAVKVSELEGISSAPHKEGENYFTSADFQKLDAIVEKVIEETCRPIVPDECDESKMDLVFVLDSSGSIRDNNPQDQSFDNWVLVLQFVINIVNRLSIGAARVGVVKFSNVGENVFYLNTHSDKAAIISAVQSIKYVGGNTNTSGGIRVMRTEQFVGMRGDRSDIQNIAIVITDGSSTFDKDLTIPEAELARQQGIRMYSVGITRNVNDAELKAMSSVPQEQDQQYWVSTDFTALTKIVDTLVKQACAPSTPTLPPMDHLIDVVFILDSSRAVGSENWKLMLEFVVSLAERMVVGFSGIRIGVVRYSNIAESMFYLNSYYDMVSMKNAILNIGYLGSFTNTAGGIREMHYMQYNIARGARASIYNYAILISGGASDIDSRLTLSDAKAAKEDGIRILCIAVGSGVYADELAQISSEPNIEGRTYWKVGNYQDLPRYREEILSETKLTTPAPTIRPDCATNVVDLVFVLDGSGSIRDNNPTDGSYDNWELLLDFVSTVIDRLSIGFSQSRVGIVKYSKDVESVFYLDTYMDKGAMMNAVRSISYMGSFTNTAGGIREMHYNQFTSQHGDRSNVQNIAIIITDGQSNVDEQTTIPEAIAARNDGIRILTVGITNAVDEKELKEMSSMPQLEKMTYWMSTDFTTLGNVINAVVEETCATQAPATPATTTPRAPSKDCVDNVADLVFVLDNSGSIRDNNPVDGSYDNWNLLLDFVANIVRQLDIGSSATRVGVVSYSRDAQSKFYLNTFSDKNRLIDAVLDLEYVGSFTNTSGGLREMHFKQFSSLYGDRPLVQDIAIVITDGVSNVDEYRTISDAVAAQKDGIKILSVGITDSVKEEELREISSAPQTEGVTYWKSTDFLKLGEVIDAIVVETCADAPVPVIPGDTGHTGHTGLQGATGSHGATGFTGFPGRDGEIGKEGSVGATGPRGNSGFPGRDGNTGSTGASGYVGRDGQPGRNGATGESGRQGIPGVGRDGFPGATGFPGRDGSTGHTGLGGLPGSSGDTGSTGRDGLRGSDGATGIPGQPGSDGRKGDQGATGFNGRAGSNGATGFQGRDGATGSTGREGRIGATGRQGLEGSTGYTGSKGRDGMTGSTGSAGFPGRDGATGRIGEAGRDGRTGSTGATGFIGRDGATGATGFEGRKGSTGSSGAQGRPGFDGRPGNAGKEGITGSTGRQGSTGATGFEGRPGAMGVTGPQGRPGSMGPGGLPGRRGSTGVKGFDGRTGDTGHTGGTGLTGREGRIGATGRLGSTGHTGDEGLHGATGREGRMGSTGLSGQIGATGIGRTGATGFTGREGRFGAPGLTGNEGRTGSTGRVGSPGSTGQNGITGSTGTTGPAGRDGLAGSTGATGNIGRIGDTGSTGRDGRIGDAGSTGLEGKAGATGLAGFDGRDGFPGVEGKIGSTGFNGLPGLDGRSGDSGHTGVPGRTGPAGRPGFDGLSGDTGVIGRQGSTGLRGDPGITGKTGSTGRVGESGNAGATGASGFQGRDGENGRNGVDGRTGLTGATGREGLVGATGRNGNDGRTGSTGATGFPGADGRVGERGFAGREGNAGATGREGKQGDTGFNGLPGNTGSTGRPGFDGRPGSTGSTGRTGRTGETGSRGATGFAGREGLTGSTGNTGDRGLTGLEGKIGATGRPGLDGGKGSTGSAGRQGFDGRTGDTGATGTFGRTGERGFEGKIGSTGRQGRNGVDGRPGASGVTGRVGSTGLRGLDGRDGSNGKTGSTGIRGFDGRRGLDGKTGSTGATGFSGRDGATGLPGRDGKIGSTGPSGSDGRIGATGLAGRDGVGRTGANGALGRRGFNGAPGFDGKTGSTGATGERGFVGETGRTGRDGAVGATGEGRTGATGRDGLPGREGPAGYTGERGSFGRAGRTGATGPAGPRGAGCAVNECYGNNGGCSHLCIDTYDSFHCACRPGYVQPQIPINCPGVSNLCEQSVLDLVFVIDSSGSIRKANPSDNSYDNWELMLRFVNSIVDGLNIGLQQTRIGVVKFSNLGLSQFYLRDYDNKQSVKDAVYRISYDDGNTNTSGGLKEMTFNQFRFDQGDRPEVPNIAIVLTDGISTTDNILTVPSAEEAHRRGIKVFSVGVTTSIDEEELRLISSSPQEMNRNYFTSANFQDLNLLTQQILTETCTTRGADNLYCETSIFEDVQCYCKYNVCSILTVNSTQCVDVNECLFHNGECQQDCVNLVGSYRCECGEGYTLREDYHTCADIDECRNNPCAPGDLCTNTYGSYVCLREGGVAGLEGLNQMKMEDSANPVTATALIGASVISALVAIVGAIVIMLVIRRSLKSKQTTQRKAKDSENHNAAPVDPNMSFNSMVENLHF